MIEARPPYVGIPDAIRLLVGLLPEGNSVVHILTGEWISRGYASLFPPPPNPEDADDPTSRKLYGPNWRIVGPKAIAAFRRAAALLKEAVLSPEVKFTGASAGGDRRQLRDDERGLRLEIREGLLATPYGKSPAHHPAFLQVEVCAEDLLRWANRRLASSLAVGREGKNKAVDAVIKKIGLPALIHDGQKVREQRVIQELKQEYNGLSVTDRFVRKRIKAIREDPSSERS